MSDKFDWEQLSQQWQQQPTGPEIDIAAMKRRLFWRRVFSVGLITLDAGVTVFALAFLYIGIQESYHWSLLGWLAFCSLFGIVVGSLSAADRIRNWYQPSPTTRAWLRYEIQRANSQLRYARITNISLVVFTVFFHSWILLSYWAGADVRLEPDLKGLLIYAFCLGWMGMFWLIARKMEAKACCSLEHYSRENEFLK